MNKNDRKVLRDKITESIKGNLHSFDKQVLKRIEKEIKDASKNLVRKLERQNKKALKKMKNKKNVDGKSKKHFHLKKSMNRSELISQEKPSKRNSKPKENIISF